MTPKEFIDKIVELYIDAQNLRFPNKRKYNITRSGKHKVHSITEDLFAVFMAEELDDSKLQFIIDQTFRYTSEDGIKKSFKPDLAIIKNDMITHIFDVKMDLGFNRNYQTDAIFLKAKERFQRFRKSEVLVKNDSKNFEILVSTKIINQIVVITTENGGTKAFQKNLKKEFQNYDWTNIYYLTSDFHPNNCKDRPKVNTDEFHRLLEDTRKNLI